MRTELGLRRKGDHQSQHSHSRRDAAEDPHYRSASPASRCALVLFFAVCVLGLDVNCGGSKSGGHKGNQGVARYGFGPAVNGSVTYQPDVVIVAGGSDSIRSVSSNGLVWTIDGHAAGARDLGPGKIMFATSEAAGRVVKMEPAGDDIAVTLAPVELTDIVRNGRITIDQSVNLDSLSFQPIPDLLGAISSPGNLSAEAPRGSAFASFSTRDVEPVTLAAWPLQLTAAAALQGEKPPPPAGTQQAKAKVGDWDVTAYKSATIIGLKGEHGLLKAKGLKVGIDVYLEVENLHVVADVPVAQGVVGSSTFRIDGIRAIGINLEAGASEGLGDNQHCKIELPIEISQPVIIGGFPATLKFKFKFLVETAFSAKNGNLRAKALWGLDGPLGFDGTTVLVPTFSVKKSIYDDFHGPSVGANGIVLAAEFRFGVVVGLPIAGAGPYAAVVTAVGLTVGSSIGIIRCRGASLNVTLKGGVGISMSKLLKAALEKLLGVKVPEEKVLLSKDIVNRAGEDCKRTFF